MILIIGILIIIIGLLLAANDGDADEILNPLGVIIIIVGLCVAIWGGYDLFVDDKPQVAASQPVVVTDSTQVQARPDSIYAIQYVISWKDASGVSAGGVKFLGHTEKEVGDTLTIFVK